MTSSSELNYLIAKHYKVELNLALSFIPSYLKNQMQKMINTMKKEKPAHLTAGEYTEKYIAQIVYRQHKALLPKKDNYI